MQQTSGDLITGALHGGTNMKSPPTDADTQSAPPSQIDTNHVTANQGAW